MSNWSEKSQHHPEILSGGFDITNGDNNDLPGQELSQTHEIPSNELVTKPSKINLNSNTFDFPTYPDSNVIVKLADCMKCSVRISRCEVEQYIKSSDKYTQTDFIHQGADLQVSQQDLLSTAVTMKINLNHTAQDLPQEQQDNLSQSDLNPQAPPPTPEDQDKCLNLAWYFDDHGFMETYIFIDDD